MGTCFQRSDLFCVPVQKENKEKFVQAIYKHVPGLYVIYKYSILSSLPQFKIIKVFSKFCSSIEEFNTMLY